MREETNNAYRFIRAYNPSFETNNRTSTPQSIYYQWFTGLIYHEIVQ